MNKVSELKILFRTINDGLIQTELLPQQESRRIIHGLKMVNEEMCDYVIELVKAYDRLKMQHDESRRTL